jgi:subtilase family serine protease
MASRYFRRPIVLSFERRAQDMFTLFTLPCSHWFQRFRHRSTTPGCRPRARFRPGAEQLENRIVPSFTGSFTPADIQQAYGLNLVQFDSGSKVVQGNGQGQTIALIEAGYDPNIVTDLKGFDTSFRSLENLNTFGSYKGPMAGSSKPYFEVINDSSNPVSTSSPTDSGGEIDADIEWAHAIAPMANIIDVAFNYQDSTSPSQAMEFAAHIPGVSVVSTSWSAGSNDQDFTSPVKLANGKLQYVTFLAASGDGGTFYVPGPNGLQVVNPTGPTDYSADPQNVISVGGTELTSHDDRSYQGETGWGFTAPLDTFSPAFFGTVPGGNWIPVSSGGFNGGYSVGSGNVTVTWTIPMSAIDSDIGATSQNQGILEVSGTWPGVTGGTTNSTFQFYDEPSNGGALTPLSPESSIIVNQSDASSGVPDGNGSFQELGVFTVGGEDNSNDNAPNLNPNDTLLVVLNGSGSNANGNVVADTIGVANGSFAAGNGGQSTYDPAYGAPAFQESVNPSQTYRYFSDVSLNASNWFDEYDSFQGAGQPPAPPSSADQWEFAGTSVASPCWAGLIAIADQGLALKVNRP